MRVFISYRKSTSRQTEIKEIVDAEDLPIPRVGDRVLVEGQLRQIKFRHFHIMGLGHSGNWDNTLPVFEGERFVLIGLH